MDGQGVGIRFLAGEKDYSLPHSVQAGSDDHTAYSLMCTGAVLSP
jgi:hypothetical protein